jgi:uncharacterized protein with GYD domain
MTIFITQGGLTREYIRGGLTSPEDRQAAISQLREQSGGRPFDVYSTLSQHLLQLISEMPDARAVSISLAASRGGIQDAVTTPSLHDRGSERAVRTDG